MITKIAKFVACSFVCLIVVGCVAPKKLTRDEYLKTTSRTYENVNQDQVLKAAERLFYLSDGDDYTFHHSTQSITAIRPWLIYLVLAAAMGTDVWTVQTAAKKDSNNVDVTVYLSTSIGGNIVPMVGSSGSGYATGIPGAGGGLPMSGTATYELFWRRLDYLLGKTNTWATCKDIDKEITEGKLWGDTDSLCSGLNVKDNLPQELQDKQNK